MTGDDSLSIVKYKTELYYYTTVLKCNAIRLKYFSANISAKKSSKMKRKEYILLTDCTHSVCD